MKLNKTQKEQLKVAGAILVWFIAWVGLFFILPSVIFKALFYLFVMVNATILTWIFFTKTNQND